MIFLFFALKFRKVDNQKPEWFIFMFAENSYPEVFCKKGVLENFAKSIGKQLYQSPFLTKLQAWGLQLYLKKETLAQVFSCEFCEISKNTYFHRTPLVAASGLPKWRSNHQNCFIKKVFLNTSQSSQGNNCIEVSFSIKVQEWSLHIH